ncbi:Mob1/phocein [Ramicandelaber brevisporus]|nr:Mob1/phocein [Ramicandelaber brevisporus]
MAERAFGSGNSGIETLLTLPEGEQLDEWIALHLVDFFNHVNLLWHTVQDECTTHNCPRMTVGDTFEYLWCDWPVTEESVFKNPTKVAAPQYVSLLMEWGQRKFSDPKEFPRTSTKHSSQQKQQPSQSQNQNQNQSGLVSFPPAFRGQTAPQMFKRLVRVYAHLYAHHLSLIRDRKLEVLLNTSCSHVVKFGVRYAMLRGADIECLATWLPRIDFPLVQPQPTAAAGAAAGGSSAIPAPHPAPQRFK